MANTPVNIIGFETGDLNERGTTAGSSVNVQSTIKRSGSYALRINPGALNTSLYRVGSPGTNGTIGTIVTTDIYFGFYFYYVTKPASSNEPLASTNTGSSTLRLELRLNSDGTLSVYDQAANLITTGSTVLDASTWYKIDIRSSVGVSAAYEVRINNTVEMSGTADQSASANFFVVVGKSAIRGSQAVDFYYDDLWVDTAGYAPGSYNIGIMKPMSDSTNAWIGSYADIDEVPIDVANYVVSNGTSAATFNMQTFADTGIPDSCTIHVVKGYSYGADTDNETNSYSVGVRSNVTNSMTSNFNTTNTAVEMSKITTADPNTSTTWTKSGLEAAKIRLNEANASADNMRVYAAFFMVAYTPNRKFDIT